MREISIENCFADDGCTFVTGNELLKPNDKNKQLPDVIKEEQKVLKAAVLSQSARRALSRTAKSLKEIIIEYVNLCRESGCTVNPTISSAYAIIMQDTVPKPVPERKPSPGRTGKNCFSDEKSYTPPKDRKNDST